VWEWFASDPYSEGWPRDGTSTSREDAMLAADVALLALVAEIE